MELLTDKWIPVLDERASLEDALNHPLLDIQTGRPDFNFALLIMLIGFKQTGYKPAPCLGDGPRFLQSLEALNGTKKPIGQLLLDEPSENALKKNTDFFTKRGQYNQLCPYCAVLALYAHTQFRGPLGAGLYPGNLYHSALYIKRGETLGETIEHNMIDQGISPDAYFSVANQYWLSDPSHEGECALCSAFGPVITSFWRNKGTPVSTPNPHCAKTKKGKRYAIAAGDSLIDIMEGAAAGSKTCISPLAINENACDGDTIIGFGTHYNKATLTRMFSTEFILKSTGFNHTPIQQCIKAIWKMRCSERTVQSDSALVCEIKMNASERIAAGMPETKAALEIFEMYSPKPSPRNQPAYNKWKEARSLIERLEPVEE